MDSLSIMAASGMRARMDSLDMLANNLANSGAAGFKADRENYNTFRDEEAFGQISDPVLPVVEKRWTDFSQGVITPTGNPVDIALAGEGFVTVAGPSGPLYTRNGKFQVAPDGILRTQEGYSVTGKDGKPVRIDTTRPVEITPDGILRQGGQQTGQFSLVQFANPQMLNKIGNSYFVAADPNTNAPKPAQRLEVQQGKLESANVSAPEAAVRLVSILRQFETMQKALLMAGEMNRRSVEEVAKVSA